MLIIFTALFAEARPFIKKYHMKQLKTEAVIALFKSTKAEIFLCITGTGITRSSAAAGITLTLLREHIYKRSLFCINTGTCALLKGSPGLYRCAQITDAASGKDMYPDIIHDLHIPSAQIISYPRPFEGDPLSREYYINKFSHGNNTVLYDEEAAGLFTGLSFYLSPDRTAFLKFTSDNGLYSEDPGDKNPGEYISVPDMNSSGIKKQNPALSQLIQNAVDQYFPKIAEIVDNLYSLYSKEPSAGITQEYDLRSLSADMHCTVTMQNRLFRIFNYISLCSDEKKGEISAFLKKLYNTGILPAKTKEDGKNLLKLIERFIFNSYV